MRAVKSRQTIIQTATDLYQFGIKTLEVGQEGCTHYRRKFIFVDSATVEEQRRIGKKSSTRKTLKRTREVHAIKAMKNGLIFRNTSCYCDATPCSNGAYVDEWKQHTMQGSKAKSSTQLENESSLTLLSTSTLEYLAELNETQVLQNEQENDREAAAGQDADMLPVSEEEGCPDNSVVTTAALDSSFEEGSTSTSTSTPAKAASKTAYPVGSFVSVFIHGARGEKKLYNGIIQNCIDGEFEVKFMLRRGDHYIWPEKDDISVIPVYDIAWALPAPQLVGRGRYIFS